jgi:signal transduction histidine kinase
MRLSVRAAIVNSVVVVVAVVVIVSVTVTLMSQRLEDDVSRLLEVQLSEQVVHLRSSLSDVAANARAIATGPALQQFLADEDDAVARVRLDAALNSVVATHPNYFQLRFLDARGQERARIDRRDGKVVVVPPPQLQDKSKRDYVPPMLNLAPGAVYVSRLNLNREHGVIERPLRPTLRLAVPVFDRDGRRQGGVIVNLDAESLLPPRRVGEIRFLVVDERGAYLRHTEIGREFGLELEHGTTLASERPALARRLDRRTSGVERWDGGLEGGVPDLLAFRRIAYNPWNTDRRWLVIAAQPQAVAFGPIDSLIRRLVLAALAVTLLACLAGWISAYGIVRPLQQIGRTARRIADGDLQAVVDARGPREVADMGHAFNRMTGRLRAMIDQERQAHDALAVLNQELERSNRELENFARAASHDLRTPLRALRTLPEWIEDDLGDTPVPDEVRQHLVDMKDQGERMEQLITGLLQYARIGKEGSRVETIEPAAAVQRMVQLLALPKSFTVAVDFTEKRLNMVPTEFDLIMRNLIQNAAKHHDQQAGRIEVSGARLGEHLVIEVRDDGPGIPPKDHAKIFEPLCALRSRDDGGGNGLGLALVKKIVECWSGQIEVFARPGMRGTIFRITLPAAAFIAEAGARPTASSKAA